MVSGGFSSAGSASERPQRVEIAVRSSYVRTALTRQSTLHLKVTDCQGSVKRDFIFLYYGGLQVDGTSSEASKRLKEILPWNGSIRVVAQLPESLLSGGGKLCGELHGGSMFGVTLPRHEVEIVE
jgi:hypothetical protein